MQFMNLIYSTPDPRRVRPRAAAAGRELPAAVDQHQQRALPQERLGLRRLLGRAQLRRRGV